MILEVSGKQDYIFSGKKLRENAERSAEIAYVTDDAFFRDTAGELYDGEKNLIYGGGGHAVLQFENEAQARRFGMRVSEAVLRRYPGMELFVKLVAAAGDRAPGDELQELLRALERKKALRSGSFHRRSLGPEQLDGVTHRPRALDDREMRAPAPQPVDPPEGWSFPSSFDELTGKDNFIAVVHIDGNAMGARVNRLYGSHREPGDWERFRRSAKRFSEGIREDFAEAFRETAEDLAAQRELWAGLELREGLLPLRPVILAGDDVCFVSAGSLGLSCAKRFLEKLRRKRNREDGLPYAACAGVAMVHQKYPFHSAYDLAEELCSNAKRFGAELDGAGRVSAMDWHIDFGQLKDGLGAIREDYATEDGRRLELRPVTVVIPEGVDDSASGVRTWSFFRSLCSAMQGEYGRVARSKIKDLREALKQGDAESRFFLRDKGVTDFLSHCFDAEHAENAAAEAFRQMRESGALRREAFREAGGVSRCLLFDAIEMIDHCVFLKEGEE